MRRFIRKAYYPPGKTDEPSTTVVVTSCHLSFPSRITMGFDKDSNLPVVNPTKKTTQVNLYMAVAIVVFFVLTAYVIWRVSKHPPQKPAEVTQPVPPVSS
ncbi:MAG TPA: hypothetical protein VKC60_06325 [Opitutaceae bacterium]|nr:hypothetical protein [Opitutaceae bacterium]